MKNLHLAALLAALGLVAACNTVEGAGEDIEAGGAAVSETADDVQQEMAQ